MKKNAVLCLFILVVLVNLTACSINKVEKIEKVEIDSISGDKIVINCSDEVNRDKTGNINSIGYLCQAMITDKTKFIDQLGNDVSIKEFKSGDIVKIILAEPVDINEEQQIFYAGEVIMLKE
jgi:hypothetical protein